MHIKTIITRQQNNFNKVLLFSMLLGLNKLEPLETEFLIDGILYVLKYNQNIY
jgi:hypothetical protein